MMGLNKFIHSLKIDLNLIFNNKTILLYIAFAIFIELCIRYAKYYLKNTVDKGRLKISSVSEMEKYDTDYFAQNQRLEMLRSLNVAVFIVVMIAFLNIQALSILAVGIAAIIINLKEVMNSMFAYFFMFGSYQVGDDIKVGDKLGEVVKIKVFFTSLAGKDENGEYNGKLHIIPNKDLMQLPVERQELKTDQYRRIRMDFTFDPKYFEISFDEFVAQLRKFLGELLPERNFEQVGNYKGFVGVKFKINFEYNEHGNVVVKINFISSPQNIIERKLNIVSFIESKKIQPKLINN